MNKIKILATTTLIIGINCFSIFLLPYSVNGDPCTGIEKTGCTSQLDCSRDHAQCDTANGKHYTGGEDCTLTAKEGGDGCGKTKVPKPNSSICNTPNGNSCGDKVASSNCQTRAS